MSLSVVARYLQSANSEALRGQLDVLSTCYTARKKPQVSSVDIDVII